jgi:membrane protease YdiL (CAAX protease family)
LDYIISDQFPSVEGSSVIKPSWLSQLGAFTIFLICGTAVFVFGSNYFTLFPTNESNLFRAVLAVLFLSAALVLRRTERFQNYARVTYAFFIAIMAFLLTSLLLPLQDWMLELSSTSPTTLIGAAVSKYYQVLVIVPAILILTRLAGGDLGFIYLSKGKLKMGLIAGGVFLLNFVTGALMITSVQNPDPNYLGEALLWVSIFSFGNALMEELWFRGIFLRRFLDLIGVSGAVILTSIIFSLGHVGAVYMDPGAIPVFLIYTFTLGVGTAYLMYKTGSLWGSVLIHMAADILMILALG